MDNEMTVRFSSLSQNEGLARVIVGSFAAQLNPTLEELSDIKTAVSEAVTNAIIHGYGDDKGMVEIRAWLNDNEFSMEIIDEGKGIENVEKAREPYFTTCPDQDRSGMGFTMMETFMDEMEVNSMPGVGTVVKLSKRIASESRKDARC